LKPVLFLIQGHAFPGYWRSDAARARLLQFQNVSATNAPTKDVSISGQSLSARWVFDRQAFPEIMPCLRDGGLVPLETTEITKHGSFANAMDLGFKNLITDWNFDAMIDIQSAREADVTPLPLFHNQL
jgi:hypothetical protein